MHYFKFHISDYYANTSHLSDDADLCYRRLLDYYYLNDGLLPDLKMLAKKIKFAKKEDIVLEILDEFFALENGIYTHQRADKELFEYKEKANTNKRIAQEREAKKRKNKEQTGEQVAHEACTVGEQVVHESPPNHKPLTINQEPLTNNQEPILKTTPAQSQAIDAIQAQALDDTREQETVKPAKKPRAKKEDLSIWSKRIIELFNVQKQVANDFIAMRERKGWVITETALMGYLREVQKINKFGIIYYPFEAITEMVEREWRGFKADWVIEKQATVRPNYNKKGAIDEFLARPATKKDMPVELDVTPPQNWPQVDFLDDNPFA